MTKAQLINALIDQEDLKTVLEKLLECYRGADMSANYGKQLMRQTEDILKELEDGNQPVYFREVAEDGYDCEIKAIVHEKPQVLWTHREPKEGRPISVILTA